MSFQNNVPSEYTFMEMILVKKDDVKKAPDNFLLQKVDLTIMLAKIMTDFILSP